MTALWERQTDEHGAYTESARAYAAFCVYRDMGVSRSLAKATHLLGRKPGYVVAMEQWSRKFEWVKRVEAWDAEQRRKADADREAARRAVIDRELADTARMLQKYDELLERTKLHERTTRKTLADGTTVELIEMNVADHHELVKMREAIARFARRAVGLPATITQSDVNADVTSGGERVAGLSVDSMVDMFRQIRDWERRAASDTGQDSEGT